MQIPARSLIRSAILAATLVLAVACSDEPARQSLNQPPPPPAPPPVLGATPQTTASPVVANAAPPAIAVPQTAEVPVPAYGPNPHPMYFYPPVGVGFPGGR